MYNCSTTNQTSREKDKLQQTYAERIFYPQERSQPTNRDNIYQQEGLQPTNRENIDQQERSQPTSRDNTDQQERLGRFFFKCV